MTTVEFTPKDFCESAKENSIKFQNAMDEVSKIGGGKIILTKGEYVFATVFMKSNVTVVFDDATVLGAKSFDEYEPEEKYDYPLYQDSSHSNFHCSLFVAENVENIGFTGKGKIDMRSVWDEKGVRGKAIKHRGAKCITLKECKNVIISGLELQNVTDLAVYFTACDTVTVENMKLRVYIDGISPDNSTNVVIRNCDIEAGDDGIVFKSSFNLNRFGKCENISVSDCKIKSRCNAVKFGTETNGGFENISVKNCYFYDTRICGIAVESVDGAIIDGLTFENIKMENVGTPFFVHLGKRLRGPEGITIGKIKNLTFRDITATGPYKEYDIIEWNYFSFVEHDTHQVPQVFGVAESFDGTKWTDEWQMTSNVCGLIGHNLENITFENVYLELDGGTTEYKAVVPEDAQDYPEVYVYGRILPAKAIYFRHIDGLSLKNITVKTYRPDSREDFVFDDVKRV